MLILVADDHALVREGLKHTLVQLAPDVEVVEATTAAQVLDGLARHTAVELLLLDLVMPGSEGFRLLTRVCNDFPDLPVAVLSASGASMKMRKTLDIGAAGFIPKSASAEVMLSALRLILAGGIYVPPDLLKPDVLPSVGESDVYQLPVAPPDSLTSLTTRQREVLDQLRQGKSNKHIARELDLSENTVKIHVAAILRRLGVDNRTQAAVMADAQGIGGAGEG